MADPAGGMDEWHEVAVAVQGAAVFFGGVALVADAAGVPGVVDPFRLGGALFAVGFALGAVAALLSDDARGAVANAVAVVGWVLVLAAGAVAGAVAWTGIALLAVAGAALCYRALRRASGEGGVRPG